MMEAAWLGEGSRSGHGLLASSQKMGKGAIWSLFYKGINLIHESILVTYSSPIAPPSHWASGFEHINFEEAHACRP